MESWLHVPYLPLWAINYTQLCVLVHPDKMMLGGPANLWPGRCVRHNDKKPRHVRHFILQRHWQVGVGCHHPTPVKERWQ